MVKNIKSILLSLVSVWLGGVAVVVTTVHADWGAVPSELLTAIASWPWYCVQYWIS
jgi:hypothetical protein